MSKSKRLHATYIDALVGDVQETANGHCHSHAHEGDGALEPERPRCGLDVECSCRDWAHEDERDNFARAEKLFRHLDAVGARQALRELCHELLELWMTDRVRLVEFFSMHYLKLQLMLLKDVLT